MILKTSRCIGNRLLTYGKNNYHAFSGCNGLTTITLGNGVTEIASRAFDCENLSKLIMRVADPTQIESDCRL